MIIFFYLSCYFSLVISPARSNIFTKSFWICLFDRCRFLVYFYNVIAVLLLTSAALTQNL